MIGAALNESSTKEHRGKHFGGNASGTQAQTTARCGGNYRLHLRSWARLPMSQMKASSLRTEERTVSKRGASNATRWGNGLSDQAKHASAIYARTRRMICQVREGAVWKAEQTRLYP